MTNLIYHNVPLLGTKEEDKCIFVGKPREVYHYDTWHPNNSTKYLSNYKLNGNTISSSYYTDAGTDVITPTTFDLDLVTGKQSNTKVWNNIIGENILSSLKICRNDPQITYPQVGFGDGYIRTYMYYLDPDLYPIATQIGYMHEIPNMFAGVSNNRMFSHNSFITNDGNWLISLSLSEQFKYDSTRNVGILTKWRVSNGIPLFPDNWGPGQPNNFQKPQQVYLRDLWAHNGVPIAAEEDVNYTYGMYLWWDLSEEVFYIYNPSSGALAQDWTLVKLDYNFNVLNTWNRSIFNAGILGSKGNALQGPQMINSKLGLIMYGTSNPTPINRAIHVSSFDAYTSNSEIEPVGSLYSSNNDSWFTCHPITPTLAIDQGNSNYQGIFSICTYKPGCIFDGAQVHFDWNWEQPHKADSAHAVSVDEVTDTITYSHMWTDTTYTPDRVVYKAWKFPWTSEFDTYTQAQLDDEILSHWPVTDYVEQEAGIAINIQNDNTIVGVGHDIEGSDGDLFITFYKADIINNGPSEQFSGLEYIGKLDLWQWDEDGTLRTAGPIPGLLSNEYFHPQEGIRAHDGSAYFTPSVGDYAYRTAQGEIYPEKIPCIIKYDTYNNSFSWPPAGGQRPSENEQGWWIPDYITAKDFFEPADSAAVIDYTKELKLFHDANANFLWVFNPSCEDVGATAAQQKALIKLDYNLNILNTWRLSDLPDNLFTVNDYRNAFRKPPQFIRSDGEFTYWWHAHGGSTSQRGRIIYGWKFNGNQTNSSFRGANPDSSTNTAVGGTSALYAQHLWPLTNNTMEGYLNFWSSCEYGKYG